MGEPVPRLMLAAASSGSGKTTVICALLRALLDTGKKCASFKCGPDYIDPMFHRACVGVERGANLDLFLSGEETVRGLVQGYGSGVDISVLEGVMGYYDGIAGTEKASSYEVAKATRTPVVLVVDCRGMGTSVAAVAKGFQTLRPDSGMKAVILNRLPGSLYPSLKKQIEESCGLLVAGYFPVRPDLSLESRHLGLVTAQEVTHLRELLDALAEQARQTVDLEILMKIAKTAPPLPSPSDMERAVSYPVRVAVAQDAAFCFYYPEALAMLEKMGAVLVPFSPLSDTSIPESDALLLGGGYPELYCQQLSENLSMRESVGRAVRNGMPVIAECGGFLYLNRSLEDSQGKSCPMVGALEGRGYPTGKLTRFGYVSLTAKEDNLLCGRGDTLPAHAFHYWDCTEPGNSFHGVKPLTDRAWNCVVASGTLYAGFPHLYLPGSPQAARRFLRAAIRYKGAF